jgi:hypothetical protein
VNRFGSLRDAPFGGQVLAVMVIHAVLASLAERMLTVNQLLAGEDLDGLFQLVDLMLLLVVVGCTVAFWVLGRSAAMRRTVLVYLAISTLSLGIECWDLVATLTDRPNSSEGAFALLWDTGLTWSKNILTFAVWYWFLDQGGPERRAGKEPSRPDLAFPQQTSAMDGWEDWKPGMLDYVFVAFTTSTAFSPTDTLFLSTRAKALCMLQAAISLVIIAMLAARVVNTLQ